MFDVRQMQTWWDLFTLAGWSSVACNDRMTRTGISGVGQALCLSIFWL